MTKHPLPSADYLRQLVDYDPDTGAFTHRYAPWMCDTRNTRFAGKPAFTRTRDGYRTAVINGRGVQAHRAAWAWVHGEWPDGEIDHINHDRSDNRIANLRVVTRTQNTRNISKAKNNTSGVTGVYWGKRNARWTAGIRVDRQLKYLGSFLKIEDAVAARKSAEMEYGFHTNHGVKHHGTGNKD